MVCGLTSHVLNEHVCMYVCIFFTISHLQVAPLHTQSLLGLHLTKHSVRKLENVLYCNASSARPIRKKCLYLVIRQQTGDEILLP